MSHIFDALQRSEAEREGTNSSLTESTFSVATELLELAERKRRTAGETATAPGLRSRVERTLMPGGLDEFPSLPFCMMPDSKLVSVAKEESLAAEKFRFLAVRLRQLRQTRAIKKVLVTSSIPQEGKSTVSANLACTLARRKQHKTLLLEGDLRRPTVANRFGLGAVPGLSEWLRGESDRMNIYRLDSLGVWVFPAGSAPENALELMQSGRLPGLMEQLTEWFDWIVIDSPPILPLADTSLWARQADGILLVTRKNVTEKKQLQRGLEAIERSKLLGAVVNGSTDTVHSDYYQRYAPHAAAAKA
jgi:capsular exopolysaccharide synthesis family protein